ncbi:MAG: restriction endonuclease subunit S [Patescibacteria group bacterium]|jgi:restriction endonuclease S subunit
MIIYSIIQKSKLEGALRIDAEYYQPEYLELEKRLNSLKTKTIDEICESVISFGAYSLTSNIVWKNDGVPYINVGDIHNGYINFSNVKYISEKVDGILNKSRVNNGQVLLTMAGTIGNAAVVHNIPRPANANQAIAKITPLKGISPYYLAAFLNSKYGRLQTQREIVSSVQANIFLGTIKKFKIPVFNNAETKEVEQKYKNFLNELENLKTFYAQAERILFEELELVDFKADKSLFSVVNLSEVEDADRIDAEYFQEKYKKLVKKIKLNNAKRLGDLVSIKKGFEPGSEQYYEEGKLFIRVSSLSVNGINLTDEKYLSEKLYNELKDNYQPKVGEILLTKDATPGIAYTVKEPVEGIMSGGILRLKIKENINAEYLTLCLNSVIGKMQAERDSGGSVIAHWKPEQIKNMLIPILPKEIQEKIADLVRQSHEARKKAKELLEEAKLKVEEMIENKK